MRASEWSRMSEPLGAVLPGFERFRRGFVRRHEWVAECVHADSSSHSRTAFYVHAFALPLFVPTDHLYFSYGERVGGRWEGMSDDLVRAVEAELPKLRELATLNGLVRRAQRPQLDIYHAELHLCVALIQGDTERFDSLSQQVAAWEQHVAWEGPIIDRCSDLIEIARVEGDEAGVRLLHERVPGVLALIT